MKWSLPFSLLQSFLDPQLTKEGKPYAPFRYKQIVQECYYLSKNCNTSYTDLMKITPLERKYMLELLNKEAEKLQQANEEARARMKTKK